MKINEIEIVPVQIFPKELVVPWLEKSSPRGIIEDTFLVNYVETGDSRGIILTDHHNIAAYVGFVTRLNGRVWQAKNADSYPPYQGQQLVAKIYQMVYKDFKISIQSDVQQSPGGRTLWTETLPSLGLKPMIYDTKTARITDPKKSTLPIYTIDEKYLDRYCWILEKNNRYPDQNLLAEGSMIQPYRGLWFDGKD